MSHTLSTEAMISGKTLGLNHSVIIIIVFTEEEQASFIGRIFEFVLLFVMSSFLNFYLFIYFIFSD